jgi:DNA-directed RNA polymerase subunit beta
LIVAEGEGVVEYVDSKKSYHYELTEEKFVSFEDDIKRYKLPKYQKRTKVHAINLRPIVRKKVIKLKKVKCLTEGYATENGELALVET